MIKQKFYTVISIILLLIVIGFAIERLSFLKRALRTKGTVIRIISYNTTCGSRRSRYSCTKFNAVVEFLSYDGIKYNVVVSAGDARGHNNPVTYSYLRINDQVPVVYDPKNPTKAFRDSFWDIWGTPVTIFFVQVSTFFSSLTESRKRREDIESA